MCVLNWVGHVNAVPESRLQHLTHGVGAVNHYSLLQSRLAPPSISLPLNTAPSSLPFLTRLQGSIPRWQSGLPSLPVGDALQRHGLARERESVPAASVDQRQRINSGSLSGQLLLYQSINLISKVDVAELIAQAEQVIAMTPINPIHQSLSGRRASPQAQSSPQAAFISVFSVNSLRQLHQLVVVVIGDPPIESGAALGYHPQHANR